MAFDPDQYLAQKDSETAQNMRLPPSVEGSAGFNPDQYLEEKGAKEEPGFLSKAMDYGARALDYPGGIVRTGLASAAGLIQGKTDVVKLEDLKKAAFKGQAPTSAEYLKRLGVDEGPSADLPLIGHTSLRDVEGLGLDIATDPLTTLAKGAKYFSPAGKAAEAAGEAAYKSGFKKIDEKLLEKGKQPLSDLMLKEGKTGTTKEIAETSRKMANDLTAERDALYKKASDKGVSIDLGFPLERAESVLATMKENPGLRKQAEGLEELLNAYKSEGKVPIDKLSEWKSSLYDALPDTAFGENRKLKTAAQEFKDALAADFRDAIVEGGNKAEKGLGDAVNGINEKLGALIESKKPLTNQIRRGNTTNLGTSIDALLLGHPGILTAKKAADLAKTTYARTKVGKGLIDFGKSGYADALARRGLINVNALSQGLIQTPDGLIKVSGE